MKSSRVIAIVSRELSMDQPSRVQDKENSVEMLRDSPL